MSRKPKIYTAEMRLSDVITEDYELLLVITCFGISLGFGEQSIREVCERNNVHTDTLLAVINTVSGKVSYDTSPDEEIERLDPEGLITYLKNSHHYFLDYRLPVLRTHLEEAMSDGPKDIALVVMRFFDEYVSEVHKHMGYENGQVFPYAYDLIRDKHEGSGKFNIDVYGERHDPVEAKITELKNILIKYYPDGKGYKLTAVLRDIFATEEDLTLHDFVENHLLIPIVRHIEHKKGKTDKASQGDK